MLSCSIGRGIAVSLLLLALAASAVAREPRFLTGYTDFQPHPEIPNVQIWLKPGLQLSDIAAYDRFLLLPIEVWYARDAMHRGIAPEKIKAATDYFRVSLKTALAPEYQLVDKPGDGVAVVRAAIAGVRQHQQELLIDNPMAVESLVSDADDNHQAGAGRTMQVLTAVLELEIFDARSGERLFAVIDQQSREQLDMPAEQRSFQMIKVVLDHWAERFRQGLDKNRK